MYIFDDQKLIQADYEARIRKSERSYRFRTTDTSSSQLLYGTVANIVRITGSIFQTLKPQPDRQTITVKPAPK